MSLTWFEDIYSRMMIIVSSGEFFFLKTKDMSIEIEER